MALKTDNYIAKKERRLKHITLSHENYSEKVIQQMLNNEECLISAAKKIKSSELFAKPYQSLVDFLFKEFNKNIFLINHDKLLSNFPESDYPRINEFILSSLGKGVNLEQFDDLLDELLNIATRKNLIILLNDFLEKKIFEDTTINEKSFDYISWLESELDKLVQTEFNENSYLTLPALSTQFIQNLKENKFINDIVPLGFKQLDDIINVSKGDLVIVAGRPSMGKTAFAINIMLHAAGFFKKKFEEEKNLCNNEEKRPIIVKKVLFVSLEMTNQQIFGRMVIAVNHITVNDIKRLSKDKNVKEKQKFFENVKEFSNAYDNIIVNDNNLNDFHQTLAQIQYLVHRESIGLVVIDYLQLLSLKAKGSQKSIDNRQQEVTQISKQIKLFAKKSNIPVILLSQLSRNVERRENKRPIMSDLRESGAIEQDADVIIFLYRESYYLNYEDNTDKTEEFVKKRQGEEIIKSDDIEIIIAKNRNGETGRSFLKFFPSYSYFFDPINKSKN